MWKETNNELHKQFIFKDFAEAFEFMTKVAKLAEEHQHHPRWHNEWNKVDIWLSTHDAGNKITDKDKALAKAIDKLTNSPSTNAKSRKIASSIKMFADGGSRGNPGPSASGFALLNLDDSLIFKKGIYIGETTNNQAEYQAVKFGLTEALSRGAKQVSVFLDSLLIVNQMKGIFKIKNQDLLPHYNDIKALVEKFDSVTFTHVPRELNKLADSMVNEALDAQILE